MSNFASRWVTGGGRTTCACGARTFCRAPPPPPPTRRGDCPEPRGDSADRDDVPMPRGEGNSWAAAEEPPGLLPPLPFMNGAEALLADNRGAEAPGQMAVSDRGARRNELAGEQRPSYCGRPRSGGWNVAVAFPLTTRGAWASLGVIRLLLPPLIEACRASEKLGTGAVPELRRVCP